MVNYDKGARVKKYIVLGRKNTVTNLDPKGEDRVRLTSEIFIRKPNSAINGGFIEYERFYYKDFTAGGRGTDVTHDAGNIYVSYDGTLGDFVDFVCPINSFEQNELKLCKTYSNRKFIKRNRTTSYHKEVYIKISVDDTPVIDDGEEASV